MVISRTPAVRRRLLAASAPLLVALLASGCGSSSSTAPSASSSASGGFTCTPGSITASGSTALLPLVQRAAAAYHQLCPPATINVSGGGSSFGLSSVATGASDIGDSDVPAKTATGFDQSALTDHQVAIVVFSLAINPLTGVATLTTDQARRVFTGAVTNWKQVGGTDTPVTLIERKPGSGTRLTFDRTVMGGQEESKTPASQEDSTQIVIQKIAAAPGGVSYVAVSSITPGTGIIPVALDSITPTADAVSSGRYPFYSHEHMYTRGEPSGLAASFISYILSQQFQTSQVPQAKFLPVGLTQLQSAADR